MINPLLLSQLCPSFRTSHIDEFRKTFPKVELIDEIHLEHLGLENVQRWLYKNKDRAIEHQNSFEWKKYPRLVWNDPDYPENLKSSSHPPSIISYRGSSTTLDNLCVAIVGARQPTDLGRRWVRKTVPEMCEQGITIVSGGARGIDIEAHMAAVKCGGQTVVVLPSGLDAPYPSSHLEYFHSISQKSGVIISELPDGEKVTRSSFLRRNRIIAGLAELVIIVEAKNKSGTMMTARWAIAENIELGVVPGPPLVENYEGSLNLIRDGATPIMGIQDIVNHINEKKILKNKDKHPTLRT